MELAMQIESRLHPKTAQAIELNGLCSYLSFESGIYLKDLGKLKEAELSTSDI